MLHSKTIMRKKLVQISLLCLICLAAFGRGSVLAQQTDPGRIDIFSPRPGEAVQGLVQITGIVDVSGLQSYELAFSFEDDTTQTWFQIASGDSSLIGGVLGEWDTTVLTDSVYNLLLRVYRLDGSVSEKIIEGVRVRNYSSIETATPLPDSNGVSEGGVPTAAPAFPSPTPILATATPLPPNPAAVDSAQIETALKRGGILGVVIFGTVLVYAHAKRRKDRL